MSDDYRIVLNAETVPYEETADARSAMEAEVLALEYLINALMAGDTIEVRSPDSDTVPRVYTFAEVNGTWVCEKYEPAN